MTTPVSITLNSSPDHVVVRELLYISKKGLSNSDYIALKTNNTLVNPFSREITNLYRDYRDYIGVPLYSVAGLRKLGVPVRDERAVGASITFDTKSELRDGQIPVVEDFKKYIAKGASGFVIKAPTAWGKTRVGIELTKIVGKTALIVVHNSSLLLQWRERFLEHSSLTEDDIGTIGDGKVDVVGKKVVIALVHTAVKPHVIEAYRDHFGLMLCDEVDRSVPPATYETAVASYRVKIRIGVSATLKRQDLRHIIFQKHFQQIFLEGGFQDGHEKVVQKVIIHNYPNTSGSILRVKDVKMFKALYCTRIAHNQERNALIASYLISSYNTKRKSLMLSDRTIQLSFVREILIKRGIPAEHIAFHADQVTTTAGVKFKVSKEERARAINEAPIILGTYRSMEAGTDIKTLAMLVMATPMKEVTQTKGRNERPAKKSCPVLVDLVDTFYDRAVSWCNSRLSVYKNESLPTKVVMAATRPFEAVRKW